MASATRKAGSLGWPESGFGVMLLGAAVGMPRLVNLAVGAGLV